VFAQKGYHKATTKEIAQAAGVAEGTIYNYFDTKRDLLLAMVEMIATHSLKDVLFENPPEDPAEFLRLLLQDRLRFLQDYGQVIAPLLAEVFLDTDLRQAIHDHVFRPVSALLENYFEQHVALKNFRPINILVVTRALMGAILLNSAFKLGQIDERYETISTDEMIKELVNLILKGVSGKG
jgi:AcrR family transcriptional regulator